MSSPSTQKLPCHFQRKSFQQLPFMLTIRRRPLNVSPEAIDDGVPARPATSSHPLCSPTIMHLSPVPGIVKVYPQGSSDCKHPPISPFHAWILLRHPLSLQFMEVALPQIPTSSMKTESMSVSVCILLFLQALNWCCCIVWCSTNSC